MRGSLVLLVLVSLGAAGCVQTPPTDLDVASTASVAGVDVDGFTPVLFDGFLFQELDLVKDGLRIHADVYLPDGATTQDAPTKFPTIVMLSPYWGAGTRGDAEMFGAYDLARQRLLPRGYALAYADLAGNGGASGCWDFMGPIERASAVATVEAIAEQEWSDGKIGMYGISYDGMTQIMAASDQAPHLVTVVPAAPLTSAYKGLIQNGVHYGGGWRQTVVGYESASVQGQADPFTVVFGGPNAERAPGWLETVQRSPQCLADNHQGYQPTNAYTDYFAARDYQALGADVKASVFYIQGFMDGAVKPDNFGAWFDAVPTTKKLWLGHWYHMYPDAQGGGRDDMFLTLHRWFDHTLKGIDNGIDQEPMVDVMDSDGGWRREAAWPPADAKQLLLQLDAGGALVTDGATGGQVAVGAPTDALTVALATSPFGGPASPLASAASFEMAAPAQGMRIAGAPWLNLTLASDRATGGVVARLYDGDRLVTHGAYNLLYAGGLDAPEPLSPGAPVTVSFAMYPTDWIVKPGSTLRLAIMAQDPDGWFESDATLAQLTLEAGESATLTIPTIERAEDAVFLTSCGWPLENVVKGCFKDLKDLGMEFED